jgi:hypothetical protein
VIVVFSSAASLKVSVIEVSLLELTAEFSTGKSW